MVSLWRLKRLSIKLTTIWNLIGSIQTHSIKEKWLKGETGIMISEKLNTESIIAPCCEKKATHLLENLEFIFLILETSLKKYGKKFVFSVDIESALL